MESSHEQVHESLIGAATVFLSHVGVNTFDRILLQIMWFVLITALGLYLESPFSQ
jgi:hypothetical protein